MTQTVKQPVSRHAGFSRRRSAVLPHLGNFFLGPIYQALTGHRGRLRTFIRRAVANGLQDELVDRVLKQSRNLEEMPHLLLSLAQDNLEKALYWDDVGVKARARDHYLESALLDIFAAALCNDDGQSQKIIARSQASYLAAAPHFACPAQPVEIPSLSGTLQGYIRFPVPGAGGGSTGGDVRSDEEPDAAAAAVERGGDEPGRRGDLGALININHPCVILFNGISSPKEELHYTENALLAAGLATLSFDYIGDLSPDGSAAGLCGDVEEIGNALWLYATSRAEIDVTRLALYGTSIGGRLALYTALKFSERFRCVATLSAPYDLLADLDLLLPAMRREFAARPSCTKEAIFDLAQRTPLRNLLPTMSLPLLVAGGTKDVIAMPEESRLIYELSSSSDKKLIVCSSAGHNCYEMMPSLRHEISTWIKQRL